MCVTVWEPKALLSETITFGMCVCVFLMMCVMSIEGRLFVSKTNTLSRTMVSLKIWLEGVWSTTLINCITFWACFETETELFVQHILHLTFQQLQRSPTICTVLHNGSGIIHSCAVKLSSTMAFLYMPLFAMCETIAFYVFYFLHTCSTMLHYIMNYGTALVIPWLLLTSLQVGSYSRRTVTCVMLKLAKRASWAVRSWSMVGIRLKKLGLE